MECRIQEIEGWRQNTGDRRQENAARNNSVDLI
jgi:hypothetical protein